jgi:phage shock protein PspC (stress-responsive transcriptional regulator)
MSAASTGTHGRGAAARRLRSFGAFWYDFVIGDDWVVAAGVVVGLAGTWGLHAAKVTAWWVLPVLLVVLLPVSLARATGAAALPRPTGFLLPPRRRGRHTPPASPRTPPGS